ncbi:PREDICTED: uncharacterized protein LOC105969416, partial [Erythranthe guttata]
MAQEFQRVISHFSHRHPLKLIAYDPETLNLTTSPCSACKLQPSPSGMLYSCTICQDYFLHQSCFEMPVKLTHPFHKHALALVTKPAYGDARFKCDACGERGNGFSYHCKKCSFDLHMLCAMLPLSVTHDSHVKHNLELSSESPYLDNKFSCDICMSIGSCQWLYRCKSCGFDAHLKCATTGDALSVLPPSQSNELPKAAPPEAAAAPPEA